MKLKIELKGFAETMSGLNILPATMQDNFQSVLLDWGEDVMTRSKTIVPVLTGKLRDSGKVQIEEMKDNQIRLNLGYGDKTAWYAAIVHERLDVRHENGQAKFLESVIGENANQL